MLRAEGATLLAVSALLCRANGESWILFALLLLVPDLSMLGYPGGPSPRPPQSGPVRATRPFAV
jgi:hypothetical protein